MHSMQLTNEAYLTTLGSHTTIRKLVVERFIVHIG